MTIIDDEHLDDILAALADPTRRRIVETLHERPRRPGELAERFEMSAPAISRHLRQLRRTGLVDEERDEDDARVRLYRIRREPFDDLRSWLDEVGSFWAAQLASLKAHAEGQRRGERR